MKTSSLEGKNDVFFSLSKKKKLNFKKILEKSFSDITASENVKYSHCYKFIGAHNLFFSQNYNQWVNNLTDSNF